MPENSGILLICPREMCEFIFQNSGTEYRNKSALFSSAYSKEKNKHVPDPESDFPEDASRLHLEAATDSYFCTHIPTA
jgi:hypothetical protein